MFGLINRVDGFFDLFERTARDVHEGASELVDLLDRFDDLHERAKRIRDIRTEGDRLAREIIERLNRTFATSLEREDIRELADLLRATVGLIEEAAGKIALYEVGTPTKEACAIGRCIRHATGALVEAMPLLRDRKNFGVLAQKCAAVHGQGAEADVVSRHALAALFKNRADPLHVIKWKDIYRDLETACGKCGDAAHVLEGVVVKNG